MLISLLGLVGRLARFRDVGYCTGLLGENTRDGTSAALGGRGGAGEGRIGSGGVVEPES